MIRTYPLSLTELTLRYAVLLGEDFLAYNRPVWKQKLAGFYAGRSQRTMDSDLMRLRKHGLILAAHLFKGRTNA